MDIRLDGHRALVTGAARNIGRAIATELAASGSHVICAYQSGKDDAEAVVDEIVAAGGAASSLQLELTSQASIKEGVDHAVAEGHQIDILVNCAAIRPRTRIADVTQDEWDRVLATNLRGPFFLAQALIPAMTEKGWGRIINLGGVDAYRGNPQRPHTVASKMGIIGLSRALANETARWGITVNTVVPGTIDSPRHHPEWEGDPNIEVALRQERLKHIPVARLGQPREVASACVFLASEESAYITGQELLVTGGMHPAVRQPALEYQ